MTGFNLAKDLARLFRLRLSLFVALSAATGHAVAAFRISWEIAVPTLACVLLAAGCSALNQYQERELDGLMSRTGRRPIPSRRITPHSALVIAIVAICAALCVLTLWCSPPAVIIGIAAIVLYNGVYTWMKRWTAFAAVPGALVGALGPAIGWVAAGGAITSPTLLAIAMVFFLWQVPHFWLLNLIYPYDYSGAGYPSPIEALGRERLFRVGMVWVACTVVATLSLPLFGLLGSNLLYLILCAAVALLGGILLRQLSSPALGAVRYNVSFAGVNMFVLVTMLLLIVESGL